MKIFAETERLILREVLASDETGFFELDSDPEVHKYLGNQPVRDIEQVREVIQFIQQQYKIMALAAGRLLKKAPTSLLDGAA